MKSEKRKAYDKKWYAENSERVKEQSKKWHRENPEAAVISTRKWQKKHPDAARRWKNTAYHTRPTYRIEACLRSRLARAVKAAGSAKSGSTVKLLGCPWIWIEVHLESLFTPGMTWENHGPVWHIDHIKPCAKFNLTDPEQQRICFHWTNLQPLFASDNFRKSDSYHG